MKNGGKNKSVATKKILVSVFYLFSKCFICIIVLIICFNLTFELIDYQLFIEHINSLQFLHKASLKKITNGLMTTNGIYCITHCIFISRLSYLNQYENDIGQT